MGALFLTKSSLPATIALMLMIRLQRIGRKHEPAFRLVLTDSKNSTKSGKSLEILGNYDSRRGEKAEFKSERILYWMSKGAKTTDTVHNLLIDKKIISGKKINKLPRKTPLEAKASPESEKVKPASNGAGPISSDELIEETIETPVVREAEMKNEEIPTEVPAEETVA